MVDTDHQSSHYAAALIGSNDDLLTEILVCLPVVSICRFKCVSRNCRSLLSDTSFTLRYDTKQFHKSSRGLFIFCERNRYKQYIRFGDEDLTTPRTTIYVPFDDEDLTTPHLVYLSDGIRILQHCNGLLLCSGYPGYGPEDKYYVLNPTTNQLVIFPSVPGGMTGQGAIDFFMDLAFHQTDCAHYKVVCIFMLKGHRFWDKEKLFQIQTYSSDTREWKISVESFSACSPNFGSGVYWNGAIHWATSDHICMYFKVNVEQLQWLTLPLDEIPSNSQYLGESRGHLHLIVYSGYKDSYLPLKVYEILMDRSGWFVKYRVELDELKELQRPWMCNDRFNVIDMVRGEKDEDTFMVLRINGLHITYNVHDKSFKHIIKLNNIYEEKRFLTVPNSFHRYSQTLASL